MIRKISVMGLRKSNQTVGYVNVVLLNKLFYDAKLCLQAVAASCVTGSLKPDILADIREFASFCQSMWCRTAYDCQPQTSFCSPLANLQDLLVSKKNCHNFKRHGCKSFFNRVTIFSENLKKLCLQVYFFTECLHSVRIHKRLVTQQSAIYLLKQATQWCST